MKTAVAATALAGAALAANVPRQAAQQNIDPVVLNFALTLEHLENTYYRQALQKFSAADFTAAGAPSNFYQILQYIASDEATHVKELTSALEAAKVTPVKECTYNFPYTDAKSFLGLTAIIEGVGTSAYLGGAPLITSKDYLTAAGSILVSEALHTSYLRNSNKQIPNANPNGTPLDPTSVYSIVAPFFKECPKDNPALPFKAYPAASGPSAATSAGQQVALKTNATLPADSYLTFVSGLAVVSVKGTASQGSLSAAVPKEASGQTYVLITKSAAQDNKLSADSVIAGPAIIEVTPAPPMTPSGGNAPSYGSGPSTGGMKGNGTAPAPSTGSGAPAPMPAGAAPPTAGAASPSTGARPPTASTSARPAPQTTNAGAKYTVGGASFLALFAGVMLL